MTSSNKLTKEELLEKSKIPGIKAMKWHPFYKGKIEIMPKCRVKDFSDFGVWYTPGVAKPCLAIKDDPNLAFMHTNKGNAVAVVSNGTRVLGLGNIGAQASMPVMEGKALLFKYLGGVDAYPICLDVEDPDKLIEIVKILQPSFGGINLEDIKKPDCFHVLDSLRSDPDMKIPVWHDDQQGTAAITLAGLINALKIVGKKMDEIKIVFNGAGAANVAIFRLCVSAGIKPENAIMTDSKGIISTANESLKEKEPYKWDLALKTNKDGITGPLVNALKGADVLISYGANGPGALKIDDLKQMATDSIVMACENPIPGIWPWEAKEAGVKVFATGRSDFANQVNNSLGFPAIFRGTLDVNATTITDPMCIAAALEIAKVAEEKKELSPEYIVPTMSDWELFPREAVAVAMKAQEEGVARIKRTRQDLYENAERIIKRSRDMVDTAMKQGYIKMPPDDE
ncbi:MAG: NAD(P)-dependent malic enzyme [Promethearchaeota archaeon]